MTYTDRVALMNQITESLLKNLNKPMLRSTAKSRAKNCFITDIAVGISADGPRVYGTFHDAELYPEVAWKSRQFDVKLREDGKFFIGVGSSGTKIPFRLSD
jgi:hypothetical protein